MKKSELQEIVDTLSDILNTEPEGIVEIIRGRLWERQDYKHKLGNLLAVIHRDGGHYETQYGLNSACKDAESIVARHNARD